VFSFGRTEWNWRDEPTVGLVVGDRKEATTGFVDLFSERPPLTNM